MIVDGQECYTAVEAAERSGYSLGTVRTYISSGEIDSIKMKESGAVFVSEKGLNQLIYRKNKKSDHPHPENEPIPIPDKPIPVLEEKIDPDISKEYLVRKSFNLYTKKEVETYEKFKELAAALGITVNSLLINVINDYVDAGGQIFALIKRQEEERKELFRSIRMR